MKKFLFIIFFILTTQLFADEVIHFNAELNASKCTNIGCFSPMVAETPIQVVLKSQGGSTYLFGEALLYKEIDGFKLTGRLSIFKIRSASKYLIQSTLDVESSDSSIQTYPLGSVLVNSPNDLNLILWKQKFSNSEEIYMSSIGIQSSNVTNKDTDLRMFELEKFNFSAQGNGL